MQYVFTEQFRLKIRLAWLALTESCTFIWSMLMDCSLTSLKGI